MKKTVFFKKDGKVIEATVVGESGDDYVVEYYKMYIYSNAGWLLTNAIIPKSKCIDKIKP